MASLPIALLSVVAFASMLLHQSGGIGMPPAPAPAAPMCCAPPPPPPCGCGGRKKREAVQPHIKNNETPCPQTEWRQIMLDAIVPTEAVQSVNAIQSALLGRFGEEKFLVVCALAGDEEDKREIIDDGKKMMPNQVHLSASGDGYCNVVSGRLWCQAAAVSA